MPSRYLGNQWRRQTLRPSANLAGPSSAASLFPSLRRRAETLATRLYVPHVTDAFRHEPWFFALAVLAVLAIAKIPREMNRGREFAAFVSSCAAMAGLMAIFGVSNYPYLIYSQPSPEHSLTAFTAASSAKTLGIMLTITLIGLPVVLTYSVSIYWIFRGKVRLDRMSY